MHEEVKGVVHFLGDLVGSTEDVSIVLLEATNTDQTTKGSRNLVSVEDTEVGIPEGKVTVTVDTVLEHDAVSGAVHRLETLTRLVRLEDEHVLLVVLVVTRGLPQFEVVDVRGDDFLVATHAVLLSDHFDQFVVDEGALREEESAAGRHFEVVEETLRTANDAMVTFLGLFNEVHVLVQLLLGRERDGVDSL